MQNLILAKYFNSFLQFLSLIKPTKKFSFEPKLKDQKIKLVYESRTYPGKNKTMKYIRKINFSQNNQNPIICM